MKMEVIIKDSLTKVKKMEKESIIIQKQNENIINNIELDKELTE
jgi:hypothetical protein